MKKHSPHITTPSITAPSARDESLRQSFSRRSFLRTAATATAAAALGTPLISRAAAAGAWPPPDKAPAGANDGAAQSGQAFIWGALLHMGTNMWSDIPVSSWGRHKGEEAAHVCKADHLRFDEDVWQALTARMKTAGMNMVVIDLGEALQYESHPELAVKGSWTIERFRKELARLRAMGLEPIPKLNFSTAHDTWLNEYERQVSTPVYYAVCADLIREVCAIFDKPRFFHLGYDEETAKDQAKYSMAIVRQGELWWHDFLFFVRQVESQGVRPWIWSDYYWDHPEEFLKRMPGSVLQSNWYYRAEFDPQKLKLEKTGRNLVRVNTYVDLDKAGFDQLPTGSNWDNDLNFEGTVEFCRKNLSAERLKGFLMASWAFTQPRWLQKNMEAIKQVETMINRPR